MIAITILDAFKRTMIDLDAVVDAVAGNTTAPVQIAQTHFASRRAGAAVNVDSFVPQNVWHDRNRLGNEIGRSLGLMSIVCLVFVGLCPAPYPRVSPSCFATLPL